MNKISLPFIDELDKTQFEQVSVLLKSRGAKDRINTLNWREQYPYCPDVDFYAAYSQSGIYINFCVQEETLRATFTEDLSHVYRDSCVEFFCKKADADYYMNFEFNCIGTCDASRRKGREADVQPYTLEELRGITRYSDIKRTIFDGKASANWELTVKIPFTLLGIEYSNIPEKIAANFYKCGDDTDKPHFLSWNPINTERPDFHVPQFFGELYFI